MRTVGNSEFPIPVTKEDHAVWQPHVTCLALEPRVLLVATTRKEGAWKCYCGIVEGENHEQEQYGVLRNGTPISEGLARSAFPEFEGVKYAR